MGKPSDPRGPEGARAERWAAQHTPPPTRAGVTERLMGQCRVSHALSTGWARGLCAWVASSARRALLAPSLAFSFLSLSFFFLERSPAPGVWNQPDKPLSYGGGAARTPAARRAPIRREPGRRRQRPREPREPGRPRARPPPPSQAFLSAEALARSQRPGRPACRVGAGAGAALSTPGRFFGSLRVPFTPSWWSVPPQRGLLSLSGSSHPQLVPSWRLDPPTPLLLDPSSFPPPAVAICPTGWTHPSSSV